MNVSIDITLNNIQYEHDVHSDIAYLQAYLQDLFKTEVEVEIDDLDYSDKISLAKQVKASNG